MRPKLNFLAKELSVRGKNPHRKTWWRQLHAARRLKTERKADGACKRLEAEVAVHLSAGQQSLNRPVPFKGAMINAYSCARMT